MAAKEMWNSLNVLLLTNYWGANIEPSVRWLAYEIDDTDLYSM